MDKITGGSLSGWYAMLILKMNSGMSQTTQNLGEVVYCMKVRNIIIIGMFIIVIVSCGIFINYELDILLQQPGRIMTGNNALNLADNEAVLQGENGITGRTNQTSAKADVQYKANIDNTMLDSSSAGNKSLVNDLQIKAGQPIDKIDVLKASVILMRKLSAEDISYLSSVALKDSYSQEDYQQSQEILLNKLSVEDINTLKTLGRKYGNELIILNSNAKS